MLNRELEKECIEFRRRWKTQKLVGEGDCAGAESKLRKVERQTRDKKIEKKESKIPYIIEHMTYDRHRNEIKIKLHTLLAFLYL